MNKLITFIVLILFLFSCVPKTDTDRCEAKLESESKLKEICRDTISFGSENSIRSFKLNIDTTSCFFINSNIFDTISKHSIHFLRLSSQGKVVEKFPVKFQSVIMDYIENDECFFAISTDRSTMGGPSVDYLCKYDKKWKLLWINEIASGMPPCSKSIITIGSNNEILVISDIKKNCSGLVFYRFSLDGKKISERYFRTDNMCSPFTLMQSNDANYYLTASLYEAHSHSSLLWLLKIDLFGDTIWTKKYPDFYPNYAIFTKSSDLLFYGSNYSNKSDSSSGNMYIKIISTDLSGNVKWINEIKQNYSEYPGNVVELENDNFLFSSSIIPHKDSSHFSYLFVLNSNGILLSEKKFNFSIGRISVPIIVNSDNGISMLDYIQTDSFKTPFSNKIIITKLSN
ncbi:MAG: hypothetical protein IPO21_16430 [Bacteroidales bacterium]|nr:hypothetical protein [Bacteroidales bacterium]